MRTANANTIASNNTNNNSNNSNDNANGNNNSNNNSNDNAANANGKLIRNLTFLVLSPLFAVSLLGGLVAATSSPSVSKVAAANSGPWE